MKIYVYLDESGSIHKNSNAKYFAVGGYFVFEHSRNKVISLYRKINKDIKIKRHFTMDKEIKSFDMHDDEKRNILEVMQGVDTFRGCTKVFDKTLMRKEIVESNIFFNYAVKVLIKDCILPFLWKYDLSLGVEFILSIDNRNLRVADLNNLQDYLNAEFCLDDFLFEVTYYDSATHFGIQLADLIVNTFYNSYKDISIVKNVLTIIKNERFRISCFPYKTR